MRNIINRILSDLKKFKLALILYMIYSILVKIMFKELCPFLIVTGFPCAGCGMTRAFIYIFTGHFVKGIQMNPAALIWLIFFAWFFWNRYVYGRYQKSTMAWLAVVCAATLGIYIYRMLYKFPSTPPMIYYHDNILRKVLIISYNAFQPLNMQLSVQ